MTHLSGQDDLKVDLKVTHNYKGHVITLVPGMEGHRWSCEYVIDNSGGAEFGGPCNTYDSRQEAETAALEKAKMVIDNPSQDKAC